MYVCSMSKVRVVSVDMDERDGVEWAEQQFQHRQPLVKKNKSEIKQEKKMSKTESLFKSKLESLKKFQHSASTNNAVEKARAFFRSLELKHLGGSSNSESSASSSRRRTTTTKNTKDHFPSSSSSKIPQPSSISSSSSSSIIDDSHNTISTTTTNDSSFYSKKPSNCIATARIIRVINPNYSNAKEMIVQRAIHHEQDDHQLGSSSNFQPVLSQKTIQPPKQYFDDRNPSYAVSFDKRREVQTQYNSRPLSPVSALNPNITYLSHIYPPPTHSTLPNGNISNHQMSASLYEYRPLVCRQMESSSLMSSSFHEQSNRSIDPIIRPLPSSASSTSMSVWTQSVRRLNTEYTSTINALQQAKESLKQISPNSTDTVSKYANFVARGINNLSNNETKKPLGVTFCLTAPISQDSLSLSSSTSSQISKTSIQQNKTPPGNVFCKPKLVRPLDLDTFIPSIPPLPKLEPVPTVIEKNQKVDSIANIIKKFNNLNYSPSKLKSPIIIDNNNNNNNSFTSHINTESRDIPPKTIISDSIQSKKDQPNISALTSTTEINSAFEKSSPHVHFKSSVTTYQLEELPYESPPPPLTSSSSSSLASEDSTSSTTTTTTTTSTSDGNQIYQNNLLDNHIQEETTYTIETFYKGANNNTENNTNNLSSNHQQVVIIRENTTEEQFNLAREKQHQDQNINQPISSEHKFTTNEKNVSPLTTPLLTYLNLTVKQTTPTPPTIEKQEKIHDNYHSVEPSSHITNDFISDVYHHEDDETISDVVTINPYTHSPPSHRLNSSSSSLSSSTTSSASTVLLSKNINPIRPIPSSVTKIPSTTNGNLNKNINKSISQLPKRTTTTTSSTIANVSRLKQPSKIVPSSSKLKPPSSTIPKPIKSMIANNTSTAIATTTTTITSAMRKPTGITNQSSLMTNNSVNKTIQQQSSSSTLITGKKQQLVNGTNMTESQNPTDSSVSLGKNRVRSMVNQLNAAVSSSSSSSSRPTIPSTVSAKRIPTIISSTVSSRRPVPVEATTTSSNKTSVTSPSRPSLQRAMTINNQSPVTPSPPSTPPTINNNIPSTYKRKTPLIRSTSNVKEGLLRWCQAQVAGYPNVSVTNLSSSWSDGLAFCALTHHFFPDAFDFNSLSSTNRKDNFELAFRIAEERAGIPQLLDVSDMLMMGNTPDYKCIFTYLNSFLAKVKDIHPTTNGVEHH